MIHSTLSRLILILVDSVLNENENLKRKYEVQEQNNNENNSDSKFKTMRLNDNLKNVTKICNKKKNFKNFNHKQINKVTKSKNNVHSKLNKKIDSIVKLINDKKLNILNKSKSKFAKKIISFYKNIAYKSYNTIIKEAGINFHLYKNFFNSDFGEMNYICEHCSAFYWVEEGCYTNCCHASKNKLPVQLSPFLKYDEKLKNLLFNDNIFRKSIRYSNSIFSFASFTATTINVKDKQIYNLKIQGQVYNMAPNTLEPQKKKKSPACGQFYYYDTDYSIEKRLEFNKKLKKKSHQNFN